MPEPTEEQEVIEEITEEQEAAPSSTETKKTEKKKAEPMIPKSRLDEVIAKRDAAEAELKKLQDAEMERKKSEMTEIERLKLEKSEADARAEKAASETRELKLQREFENVADELEVTFASKEAAQDAYTFLDKKIVGDDGSGMKKAVEALQESKPYLFADTDEETEAVTDARQKGTRRGKEVLDKEREQELSSRFRIRRPR